MYINMIMYIHIHTSYNVSFIMGAELLEDAVGAQLQAGPRGSTRNITHDVSKHRITHNKQP